MRAETKQWSHGCRGRGDPIVMGVDEVEVAAAEMWDNAMARW